MPSSPAERNPDDPEYCDGDGPPTGPDVERACASIAEEEDEAIASGCEFMCWNTPIGSSEEPPDVWIGTEFDRAPTHGALPLAACAGAGAGPSGGVTGPAAVDDGCDCDLAADAADGFDWSEAGGAGGGGGGGGTGTVRLAAHTPMESALGDPMPVEGLT
jgi:hypothetical protein